MRKSEEDGLKIRCKWTRGGSAMARRERKMNLRTKV